MIKFEKSCANCIFRNTEECIEGFKCLDESAPFPDWEPEQWLVEWLSSFNTDSATTCFEAVNLLKEKVLEVKE